MKTTSMPAALHLQNQRGILRSAWGVSLIQGGGHAALVQPASDPVGKAGSKGRNVIQDRDLLVGPMVSEVSGDFGPLPVVTAAHTEHVRPSSSVSWR